MKFWDASAVVALLLDEPASAQAQRWFKEDPHLLVWWATELECVSAISRREREGVLDLRTSAVALHRLDALARQWIEVQPVLAVRGLARRLLRVHPLRAADSLQLAAALTVAEQAPASITFVCLDQRLTEAAMREGLSTIG
jgi:predicted nucleic acid-binding protein